MSSEAKIFTLVIESRLITFKKEINNQNLITLREAIEKTLKQQAFANDCLIGDTRLNLHFLKDDQNLHP